MSKRKSTYKRAPIKGLPSVEHLHQCFLYFPKTGELRWRERPPEHFAHDGAWMRWNRLYAWSTAGWIDKLGYRAVGIDGRIYQAHRIIWKWMTGEEPPADPDHKDRNKDNNVWSNLRPATRSQQLFNTMTMATNTSGHRGVWQVGKRWRVRFMIDRVDYNIGYFNTFQEACIAHEAAIKKLHGEFYCESDQSDRVPPTKVEVD